MRLLPFQRGRAGQNPGRGGVGTGGVGAGATGTADGAVGTAAFMSSAASSLGFLMVTGSGAS